MENKFSVIGFGIRNVFIMFRARIDECEFFLISRINVRKDKFVSKVNRIFL